MFAYMLKDFIYSLFFVPYMIFSLCCAVYLVLPSRYNKGRANWESIVVLLRADRAVYRPYAEQEVDDACSMRAEAAKTGPRGVRGLQIFCIIFLLGNLLFFSTVFLCQKLTRM